MSPPIAIVVAMTRARLIGAAGGLPWHLPADLQRFRAVTMGKPIIMGRRTHESIGRPLPGRRNIVVTRQAGHRYPGCITVPDLEAALAITEDSPERMVVGGKAIYAAALPLAQRMYLTEVHAELRGDTYFPTYVEADWRERERLDRPADEQNAFPYSFVLLERRLA